MLAVSEPAQGRKSPVHSPPFEVPPGPEAPVVYSMTTDFWDRYLKGDVAAADRIVSAVQSTAGNASLQRDVGRG